MELNQATNREVVAAWNILTMQNKMLGSKEGISDALFNVATELRGRNISFYNGKLIKVVK